MWLHDPSIPLPDATESEAQLAERLTREEEIEQQNAWDDEEHHARLSVGAA